MGGLIARNVLLNGYTAAYGGVLYTRNLVGLITLGAPNWGYPMLSVDTSIMCPQLVTDMAGSWDTLSGDPNTLSNFLSSLNASWAPLSYGSYWLAAAGRFCADQTRFNASNPGGPPFTGCLEANGVNSNDGVVCADSAQYSYFSSPGPAGKPTAVFDDPNNNYSHTNTLAGYGTALIMGASCVTGSQDRVLFNPPTFDPLFSQIVAVINAH